MYPGIFNDNMQARSQVHQCIAWSTPRGTRMSAAEDTVVPSVTSAMPTDITTGHTTSPTYQYSTHVATESNGNVVELGVSYPPPCMHFIPSPIDTPRCFTAGLLTLCFNLTYDKQSDSTYAVTGPGGT